MLAMGTSSGKLPTLLFFSNIILDDFFPENFEKKYIAVY